MMYSQFKVKPIHFWIGLALAANSAQILANSYYPPLPPTLSTAVTPNIMLLFDNSGSMDDTIGGKKKITSAISVTNQLISDNKTLNWGLFTFDGSDNDNSGKLIESIKNRSVQSDLDSIKNKVSALKPETWTPLGETLLEITQYFQGKASLYGKTSGISNGLYTSPIQYRCQKNFVIIMTDGDATKDDVLPGSGLSTINYSDSSTTKNFSVCTAVSSPDCPAVLEDDVTASTPGFGDSTNRFRAVRDVAKYANDVDMKISKTGDLNDLDGKSWDDVKFKKQNMQTFTVGFGVNNKVLPATANVGGGKYYTAADETALAESLKDAVASIVSSVSNAGGVAVQSEYTVASNYVFQPLFNPNGWTGELRRYNINTAGAIDFSSLLTATIPTAASRKIYSYNNVTTNSGFDFDDVNAFATSGMTTKEKSDLYTTTTGESTATVLAKQKAIINYIRGNDQTPTYRARTKLLGDIIDSQPVVVVAPSGYTDDPSYSTPITGFKDANAGRHMVFIGANDGMLHGFKTDTMVELFGYVPTPTYANLKNLASTAYGTSSSPHDFYVNGPLRQQDIKSGSTPTWKTILVGGLGQGGQGFYALNVTNEATVGTNASVLWEFSEVNDNSMGYSFSTPLIYNVRSSASTVIPAVILTNGYQNDYADGNAGTKTSALFILNAQTGNLLRKITLPAGYTSTGLSSPAGVDFGQDGVLDYVYAGDENGNMWRFDLTDPGTAFANFKVASKPIYQASALSTTNPNNPANTPPNTPNVKPIVMRPSILPVNDSSNGNSIGNLIIFGTGKLLTDADRLSTDTQTIFAVLDKMEDTPTTVVEANLVQQTVTDTKTYTIADTGKRVGTYRKISQNALDLTDPTQTKLGWFINLPTSTERIVASPLLFDDKVIIGTGVTASTEKCLPGGKGWIMGLNPLTGSIVKTPAGKTYSFIDINSDTKSTAADQVDFTIPEYASAYSLDGIPTELTYIFDKVSMSVVKNASTDNGLGSSGNVIALKESNSMGVYTANAKAGTTKGKTQDKPASKGGGKISFGIIGTSGIQIDPSPYPSSGVKLIRSTWREIIK